MFLQNTNIEQQLRKTKNLKDSEGKILQEVQLILEEQGIRDGKVDPVVPSKNNIPANNFDFDLLETDRIYHLDHIREICIDYRLRFLDYHYFRGSMPQSALSKIKKLENSHGTQLNDLKIMAPSKLFKLADKDDPLLFVPLGNRYYYLVHKWGNDLHPLRKLLVWPFKNMVNLILLVLIISYGVTLMVPAGLFSKNDSTAEFWIIFFFMFKCIASVVIFYGFALGKNFNPAIWNSKYFNA